MGAEFFELPKQSLAFFCQSMHMSLCCTLVAFCSSYDCLNTLVTVILERGKGDKLLELPLNLLPLSPISSFKLHDYNNTNKFGPPSWRMLCVPSFIDIGQGRL